MSVKHRLVLRLLQLWAGGKLLAATMYVPDVEQEPTSVRAAHCVVPRDGGAVLSEATAAKQGREEGRGA